MALPRKWAVAAGAGALAVAAGVVAYRAISHRGELKSLTGVVLTDDPDPRKQFPVENARITFAGTNDGHRPTGTATTDASGLFRLQFRPSIHADETIALHFQHPGYQPLDLTELAANRLYVFRMKSIARQEAATPVRTTATLSNLRVRYALRTQTTINVGSAAKTFVIVNTGNTPCEGRRPCSPDGKWKAAIGGASLDAGEGNVFQDARISCIAGPCPFTRIDTDGFSQGGRTLRVTVRDWSDTTVFLMEAEVAHTMASDVIRQSFPSIAGQTLYFSLPPTAQGPSIEAEIDGTDFVFPLGPNLNLSWAICTVRTATDHGNLYRCELKPGYRFESVRAVDAEGH